MTLSIPDDAFVYMLSHMNVVDVETCRAVSQRFKKLIDERQPFPECYIKAKELYANIIAHYENDPELNNTEDSIKIKEEQLQNVRSTVRSRLARVFPCISSWIPETRKVEELEIGIFHLNIKKKLERMKIYKQYDTEGIDAYRAVKKSHEVLRPIIDIFGSMHEFEKLPIVDAGNYGEDCTYISDRLSAAPIMRQDSAERIFFVLQPTRTEEDTTYTTTLAVYSPTDHYNWKLVENEGSSRPSGGSSRFRSEQFMRTPFKWFFDRNSQESEAEKISKIKTLIETKQYGDWRLGAS
jgi:hypothetical protein